MRKMYEIPFPEALWFGQAVHNETIEPVEALLCNHFYNNDQVAD